MTIQINRILLSLLLVGFHIFAKDQTPEYLFSKASQKLGTHKHFQANFTQYRSMQLFKKPLVSQGTISFSYPDKIKFHYKKPFESIILLNNNSMERYRFEQGSYVKQPSLEIVAKAITKEVLTYFNGNFSNNFPYDVSLDTTTANRFILFPKSKMAQTIFSSMEILFSTEGDYVKEIKLNEQNGDYVHIIHEIPIFDSLPDKHFTVD